MKSRYNLLLSILAVLSFAAMATVAFGSNGTSYYDQNRHTKTTTFAIGSLVKGACEAHSVTVAGVSAGDAVSVAIPSTAGILTLTTPTLALNGSVTIEVCNPSAGAATYAGGTTLTWGLTTTRPSISLP